MDLQRHSADQVETAESERPLSLGRGAHLARVRLFLVVLATALIALVGGAVVLALVAPDVEDRLGAAVRAAPVAWRIGCLLVFVGACYSTLVLARRLVTPAQRQDRLERRLVEPRERRSGHPAAPDSRAREDPLTGLGNHAAFQEEFDRLLEISRRGGFPLTLVLFDLDNFRTLNDSSGHAVGDLLLIEMSRLLRASLRGSDKPFRVGGDEFAVLLPHSSVEDGYAAARRLLAASVAQRPAAAYQDAFSFSAGVTGAPELGATRTELCEQAEEALHAAKHEGRTLIKVYDPERSTRALGAAANGRASAAVAALIDGRAIRAVYQPIVELAAGRVVGYEGLARPLPATGFDNPASLFAAADAAGRTTDLDRLCMETLLAGASALDADQSLALNISPRTLEAPEFSAAWLSQLLVRAALDPRRVILELTERQPVRDVELVRRRLAACQATGVRIAIDNVGASNAGLRLLSEIPFDIVKVDLILVQAAARDNAPRDVLRSVADLATRWGATAIAEGVEAAAELGMIQDIGLPQAQGYLLGRPLPTLDVRSVNLESLLSEPDLRASLVGGGVGFTSDLALAWPAGIRGG